MNDKELADKIIALGIGSCDNKSRHGPRYQPTEYPHDAYGFVRDPRVAMAMMDKLHHAMVIKIKTVDSAAWVDITEYSPNGDEEELPVLVVAHEENISYAINKACVEILS